jgi:hypothetical protein
LKQEGKECAKKKKKNPSPLPELSKNQTPLLFPPLVDLDFFFSLFFGCVEKCLWKQKQQLTLLSFISSKKVD